MTVMEAHKGKQRTGRIALGAGMKISDRDHSGAPQEFSDGAEMETAIRGSLYALGTGMGNCDGTGMGILTGTTNRGP